MAKPDLSIWGTYVLKETHPLGLHKKTDEITCTIFDNDKINYKWMQIYVEINQRHKQQESKIWSLLSTYMVVIALKKIRPKGKSNKSITCK